ncbi:hypothetical protein, partial [Longimicrobium sp.]|uniref:hypothetical protein n=1 Tax=Longimicrobium sp. TaxID=2029185 RepID=UPI002E35AD08
SRGAGRAPIARVRGAVADNQPVRVRIVVDDTTSPRGRGAWMALRGRRLVPHLHVRGLGDDSAAVPWMPSGVGQALLRPRDDPFDVDFITRGREAPPSLYRLDLRPEGVPAWLPRYDAERASDRRRTYGLGRLFEGVRAADPLSSPPVLRLYAVVS